MIDVDKLQRMVIDLKIGESAENFDDMLKGINESNQYYSEIVKTSKQETPDKDMLFFEFRVWFTYRMQEDILSYLKGVI